MADHVKISKTLSYWLRHKPDAAGLALDAAGWADMDAVLAALHSQRLPGDIDTLMAVVEFNDKQRFELSPDLTRIRARQGHSIEIDLALTPLAPPPQLYHGTVERFLPAIMAEGLKKMRRHHVHLSPDIETAQRVGARRGSPIVLAIDAKTMAANGALFYRSSNGVWLTDHVPPAHLSTL